MLVCAGSDTKCRTKSVLQRFSVIVYAHLFAEFYGNAVKVSFLFKAVFFVESYGIFVFVGNDGNDIRYPLFLCLCFDGGKQRASHVFVQIIFVCVNGKIRSMPIRASRIVNVQISEADYVALIVFGNEKRIAFLQHVADSSCVFFGGKGRFFQRNACVLRVYVIAYTS